HYCPSWNRTMPCSGRFSRPGNPRYDQKPPGRRGPAVLSFSALRQAAERLLPGGDKPEVLPLIGLMDKVPEGLAGIAGKIPVDGHLHPVVDELLEDLPRQAGAE